MATRLISKTWEVDGVLTDPDSVKLSDPTGTYGIKRDDTDEVVVADGTDMDNPSTGVYQYSFEDEAGVTYTAYIEVTDGGAVYYFEVDLPARTDTGTLDLTFSTLKVEVADFLGWTRDSDNWSTDEDSRLGAIVNAGYRQFIYPPPLPGEKVGHKWSFLRPSTSLETTAGTYVYDLPSDFAAMVSDMVYSVNDSVERIVEQTSAGQIDRRRALNDYTGQPYLFAVRPKSTNMSAPQTMEVLFYPTPDDTYTLYYQYDAKADSLSDANPYPLGGQVHSETLLQSCLDVAAARYRDDAAGRMHALFLERLAASIEADRRMRPKTLGFNTDGQRATYVRHGTEFSVSLKHNLGGG